MRDSINIETAKRAIKRNREIISSETIKGEDWPTYDSSIEDFGNTLGVSLPVDYEPDLENRERFKRYILEILSKGEKGNLTAVEMGGPGSKLFVEGFPKNFFIKTAGVCLEDIRDKAKQEEDSRNNHSVLAGNILPNSESRKTFSEIKEVLGAEKTDLIICRLDGPVVFIKKNEVIMDRLIRNWYDMLNQNGLMFIQFHNHESDFMDTEDSVKKWVAAVQKRFPQVDIQVNKGILRLHKRAGSPEEMPRASQLFK